MKTEPTLTTKKKIIYLNNESFFYFHCLSFRYSGVSSVIHLHLQSLVFICVFMPLINFGPCLCVFSQLSNFPHSLSAFIIMKLPKQLQPSQQEPRDSCSSTRCFVFITHVLLCSASLHSSCIYLMWNWAEQRHDAKAVVWWAWWKVESSPRWPLSGGGGWEGGREALTA